MDEKKINELLRLIPGSRRAADGIIIDGEDGSFFHLTGMYSAEETKGLLDGEHFFLAFCSKNEIIRMRNLRTAHDSLLRYRAHAIVDEPRAVRTMRLRKASFEKNGRLWSLSEFYHLMDGSRKAYISKVSKKNQNILKSLPAGMAFENEANAIYKKTFLGDFVVVSEALEKLFYFMNIGIRGAEFNIPIDDRVCALLIALRIMNGAESLDFDLDSRGDLPLIAHQAIQRLVQHQVEFTFGHEYAHYLLGHGSIQNVVAQDPGNNISVAPNQNYSKDVTYLHDQEYEADLHAIKFIDKDEDAQNIVIGAYNVFIFFSFLQEMGTFYSIRRFGVSNTHPEPYDRLWSLWTGLGRRATKTQAEIKSLIKEKDEIRNILCQCIQAYDPTSLLTNKGSIYLPNYKNKMKRDRIDF